MDEGATIMRAAGQVLVVDDDPDTVRLVRALLAELGYAVMSALSVGAALDGLWQAWDQQPDVILLDLSLPLHDGQTFADLYALLPVPRAPIVLLTGAQAEVVQQAAVRTQAVAVLHKPFSLDELLAALHLATHPTPATS
jgi:CheY-like chemotaxis protein